MKILSIETKLLTIPLKNPFITALRRVEHVEFVRVTIQTKSNIGIGEAPPTKVITGEDAEDIIASITAVKEQLLLLSPQEALTYIHASGLKSSAKAALDIALLSLLDFFTLTDTTPIQTDITISLNDSEIMLKEAQEAFASRKNILKIKLGSDISHAITTTQLLAEKLPSAILLIDANQAWSQNQTLKYIEAVKNISLALLEQPVPANDLESLHFITQKSHIPILADEAVFTLRDVKKVHTIKAADMINIKLMKCGGVTPAIEILEYARKHNIICMLGSMLEGPYSINAALYLAFNYKDVIKYVDLDSPLLYTTFPQELAFHFDGCTISYKGIQS